MKSFYLTHKQRVTASSHRLCLGSDLCSFDCLGSVKLKQQHLYPCSVVSGAEEQTPAQLLPDHCSSPVLCLCTELFLLHSTSEYWAGWQLWSRAGTACNILPAALPLVHCSQAGTRERIGFCGSSIARDMGVCGRSWFCSKGPDWNLAVTT